jgi:peroxiredoxin
MASLLARRLFLASAAAAVGSPLLAVEGRKAPAFETKTLIGRRLRLDDYRGKCLVLSFWATWCPHCRRYLAAMQELHAEYEPRDVAMLALSVDAGGWKEVAPYIRDHKLSVPIGLADAAAQRAYGTSRGIPLTALIGPDGTHLKELVGAPSAAQLRQILELLAKQA